MSTLQSTNRKTIKYEDMVEGFSKEERKASATVIRRLQLVPAFFYEGNLHFSYPAYFVDEIVDAIEKRIATAKTEAAREILLKTLRSIRHAENNATNN